MEAVEEMKTKGIRRVYLASPYTDPDEDVMEQRYEAALTACNLLLAENFLTFSPIVHCHPIAVRFGLPRNFEFWREWNYSFLWSWSEAVYVLKIEGWEGSRGIYDDTGVAFKAGKPIFP